MASLYLDGMRGYLKENDHFDKLSDRLAMVPPAGIEWQSPQWGRGF